MSKKQVKTFLKAQISAFSGGITDYGLMILLTELLHLHFAFSILISGTVGGIVNFTINRLWAFKSEEGYRVSAKYQFIRFFIVVLGSISLKSGGTYLLNLGLDIDYRIGRIMVDLTVSYCFNYPLMKKWVFSPVTQ